MLKEIKYTDIGKEVELSDNKDFNPSYYGELVDIEQIEDETWYRCKQGLWAYCRPIPEVSCKIEWDEVD